MHAQPLGLRKQNIAITLNVFSFLLPIPKNIRIPTPQTNLGTPPGGRFKSLFKGVFKKNELKILSEV